MADKKEQTNSNNDAKDPRKIAEKYSEAGQTFRVKYLGTQEVNSAKGDAEIADRLKELRTLFKNVVKHLPKVTVTLQLTGITVFDEKSKLETMKVSLDHISYVCLDPGDESVFSFVVRSEDTISSKGLRLHAFMSHPQTAITFNRSARELFSFMAKMRKAKQKMETQQQQQQGGQQGGQQDQGLSVTLPSPPRDTPTHPVQHQTQGIGPMPFIPPPPTSQPHKTVTFSINSTDSSALMERDMDMNMAGPNTHQARSVFDEWKELSEELSEIEKELSIQPQEPTTSTPLSSPAVSASLLGPPGSNVQPPELMTASGMDPFNNSFFDRSFGSSQPAPLANSSSPALKPQIFQNPVFNGHLDGQPSPAKSSGPAPLPSPENKYASRPRPKGKLTLESTALSPPPMAQGSAAAEEARVARDVSLSPGGEREVKNILANTDPFQSESFNAFEFPPPMANGSGIFQPAPLPHTLSNSSFSSSGAPLPHTPSSSSLFSPPGVPLTPSMSASSLFSPGAATPQGSLQLVNPLYVSQPFDGASGVPGQQLSILSPPGSATQPHFPQPAVPAQPLFSPIAAAPMPFPGLDQFGGVLSPTLVSPPALLPPGDPAASQERDTMFAELLPSGGLGPDTTPEKKKKFEPVKVVSPTLDELQRMKREREIFTDEFSSEWPASDVTQSPENTSGLNPEPGDPSWPQTEGQNGQLPTDTTQGEREMVNAHSTTLQGEREMVNAHSTTLQGEREMANAQITTLEDFDAAFQEASNKGCNVDLAFETKVEAVEELQPTQATNDPFVANGHAITASKKTEMPWVSF